MIGVTPCETTNSTFFGGDIFSLTKKNNFFHMLETLPFFAKSKTRFFEVSNTY